MTARIIFMGSPDFAVPSLEALLRERSFCEVVAVVTQPDKPKGRGRKLAAPAVKVTAENAGVPVLQPTRMKASATREQIAAFEPDLAVVAAYGRILPQALLDLFPRGCINVHASLLPRHRGASPVAHAILSGDATSGVSIMQMDAGMDTGPVFAREAVNIEGTDTTASLTTRLAELGARCLIHHLPAILDGTLEPAPQDDAAATYAPLLQKQDGQLRFEHPALELERRVRAFNPWPTAHFLQRGQPTKVWRAEVDNDREGEPGRVIEAGRDGVTVACGEGAIRLLEVQPPGRQRMPASAWLAGRGVTLGENLID